MSQSAQGVESATGRPSRRLVRAPLEGLTVVGDGSQKQTESAIAEGPEFGEESLDLLVAPSAATAASTWPEVTPPRSERPLAWNGITNFPKSGRAG